MSEQDNTRRAPENYVATARAFCFDLAATAFLFVSASVMAGRVWRFPFDDEIAPLLHIEPDAARELIENFPATTEIMSFVVLYLVPRHEWTSLVVGPRTRARRVNRFLRGADRAAVLDLSSFTSAPISLVVRSFLLAYCDGRRRGRPLPSLLDIQLRDDRGGGRILPRCGPFRFDEYAWLLRRQCPRN